MKDNIRSSKPFRQCRSGKKGSLSSQMINIDNHNKHELRMKKSEEERRSWILNSVHEFPFNFILKVFHSKTFPQQKKSIFKRKFAGSYTRTFVNRSDFTSTWKWNPPGTNKKNSIENVNKEKISTKHSGKCDEKVKDILGNTRIERERRRKTFPWNKIKSNEKCKYEGERKVCFSRAINFLRFSQRISQRVESLMQLEVIHPSKKCEVD